MYKLSVSKKKKRNNVDTNVYLTMYDIHILGTEQNHVKATHNPILRQETVVLITQIYTQPDTKTNTKCTHKIRKASRIQRTDKCHLNEKGRCIKLKKEETEIKGAEEHTPPS